MENEPSFNNNAELVQDLNRKESRYPNKEEILEIMSLGEPEFLGSIDDLYPEDISEHQNKVEIVNVNAREMTEIKYHGKIIKCVFKPFAGESSEVKEKDIKNNHGRIKKFYPREAFAYALSEHFGLDIVPPTVVRDFGEGRVGALQLFIPTDQYLSARKLAEKHPEAEEECWDKMLKTEDFAKMAALDFIIANCDRNPGNYLLRIIREDGQVKSGISDNPKKHALIAIDHGLCMDPDLYPNVAGEQDGPIRIVTNREEVKIPDEVLFLIKSGFQNRDDFIADLIDDEISEEEVANMWKRVEALCQKGVFLSKHNIRNYPELLKENGVLFDHPQIYAPEY